MQGMSSDTLTDKLYNAPFRMTHCGNLDIRNFKML